MTENIIIPPIVGLNKVENSAQLRIDVPYYVINITGYVAWLGGGKTLKAYIDALKLKKKWNLPIMTNLVAEFTEPFEASKLLSFELKDCILLLDELETIIDSRNPNEIKTLFSYFFLQSRKRKVFILYTTQLNGAIDKRLRMLAKTVWACQTRPFRTDENNPPREFIFNEYVKGCYTGTTLKLSYEMAQNFWNGTYGKFGTDQIIMPLNMIQKQRITFDDIKKLFDDSPTKKVFLVSVKQSFPFLSGDTIEASYDCFKVGLFDKGFKLLKNTIIDINNI